MLMKLTLSLETSVLVVVMITSFLAPFMGSAINLAIPAIGAEFSGGTLFLSWIVSGYLLASAAFLLPCGRLADIIGRKKILLIGIILFACFSLLSGLAWSMESIIVFRVGQGMATSMIFSTGMAILTSVYPPHKRGHAMGITASATYIGLSLGPVLGGFMNYYLGWRSIFFFSALAGVTAALIAAYRLKGEWADAKDETFDWLGSACYMIAITAVLYGLSSLSNTVWGKYSLVFGLVLLALFIVYESKQDYPIFRVELFRHNTVFAFSNLAAMINYSATFAVGFLVSLLLQVVMEYDSHVAGFILLAQPLMMAAFSPFAGSLSDRIQPRIVASLGMGLSTLGLFIFTWITPATSSWLIMINLAFIGLGFALFSSPNTNALMGSVEKRFYGIASSSLATSRLTGQAVSMAIVTLLLSVYVGDVSLGQHHTDQLIEGFRMTFLVFTVLCTAGIFASLARGKGH
ncbi:Riboflavin transporter RibZ [bioreactor metagenome]|uniref:Riboflavin transporter RibZ n=1 Tax=bioreactor metagenome TaxID=1076179 RepID=A0A644TUI6_9ZZZZ